MTGCATTAGQTGPTTAQAPAQVATITPANRIPLACKATVLRPALFRAQEKQIKTVEGGMQFQNIPAKLEWVEMRIQTEPARHPHETVAPVYREETISIDVERERTELFSIPATYHTVTRQVFQQSAHPHWKDGCFDSADCLEVVPDKYVPVQVETLETPARTEQRRLPTRTVQIKRKVLVTAGQGTGTPLPARYETVKVARIIEPWQITATLRPSSYQTVTVHTLIQPARTLEMPSLCPEQAGSEIIRRIQQQLLQQGGQLNISGVLDKTTQQAILDFQRKNNLAIGAITLETLRKLGLA